MLYKTPIHVLVCKVGRKTMALHRGQNRYSDFVALETLLRCLRGVGSMSSSRRIPRFIVLFSSGHRWLFFVVSLWAYVVVASFLCLRVVGSFSRPQPYIPGQVIDVWGHILYCYSVTLLPCYLFTLLPYCYVPLLFCPFVTLLPSSLVPWLLRCQFFNFSVFVHDKSIIFFPL